MTLNFWRKALLATADFLLIMVGFWLSLGLRLDFSLPAMERYLGAYQLAFYGGASLLSVVIFSLFGLYEKVWRYVGLYELKSLILSVLLVAVPVEVISLYWGGNFLPRTCPLIAAFAWVAGCGALRLALRFMAERNTAEVGRERRVLIIGANDAGELILRDLRHRNWNVVGYIDDVASTGVRIHGVPVLGKLADVKDIVVMNRISDCIVADPKSQVVRKMVEVCACFENRVQLRLVPSIGDVVEGNVVVSRLRQVQIEDLLERDPVNLDLTKLSGYLSGKCVLVTGAGGSIGSEICRQILKLGAAKVVMMGRGENSIYEIGVELRGESVQPFIGDLRDRQRMEMLFTTYHPQVVFHTAAHKHVPLMELSPAEAVSNNVFGVELLIDLVEKYKVEKFIMISTDKAVNPTSVMGVTKRMGELLLAKRGLPGSAAVRFGNVLGSRGSVIPTFRHQIAKGGPVTVTDADMTRFFMTIPEAVSLVLEAGSMAQRGEIYILDMGKPVKIIDLARNLIRLSGFEPDLDIPIKIVGLRPGEKLYEELVNSGEETVQTESAKITKVTTAPPGDNWPGTYLEELRQASLRSDDSECVRLLKLLVPQFTHE